MASLPSATVSLRVPWTSHPMGIKEETGSLRLELGSSLSQGPTLGSHQHKGGLQEEEQGPKGDSRESRRAESAEEEGP